MFVINVFVWLHITVNAFDFLVFFFFSCIEAYGTIVPIFNFMLFGGAVNVSKIALLMSVIFA